MFFLTLCLLRNFACSFSSAVFFVFFFSKSTLSKHSFRNTIRVSTVWIQIRPDKMSGLIWVQTVCNGYKQRTLGGIVFFKEIRLFQRTNENLLSNKDSTLRHWLYIVINLLISNLGIFFDNWTLYLPVLSADNLCEQLNPQIRLN